MTIYHLLPSSIDSALWQYFRHRYYDSLVTLLTYDFIKRLAPGHWRIFERSFRRRRSVLPAIKNVHTWKARRVWPIKKSRFHHKNDLHSVFGILTNKDVPLFPHKRFTNIHWYPPIIKFHFYDNNDFPPSTWYPHQQRSFILIRRKISTIYLVSSPLKKFHFDHNKDFHCLFGILTNKEVSLWSQERFPLSIWYSHP